MHLQLESQSSSLAASPEPRRPQSRNCLRSALTPCLNVQCTCYHLIIYQFILLPPTSFTVNNCLIHLIAPIVRYPHPHHTSTHHLRPLHSYTSLSLLDLSYRLSFRAHCIITLTKSPAGTERAIPEPRNINDHHTISSPIQH